MLTKEFIIPQGTKVRLSTRGYYEVIYPGVAVILNSAVMGTPVTGHKVYTSKDYQLYMIHPSIKINNLDHSVIWVSCM